MTEVTSITGTRALPDSVSSFALNLCAGLVFLSSLYVCNNIFLIHDKFLIACAGIMSASAVIIAGEILWLKVHKRERVGFSPSDKVDPDRLALKLSGLYITAAVVLLIYTFVPEYRAASYDPFREYLAHFLAIVLVASGLYVIYFDGCLREPYDGLWHFTAFILRRPGADAGKFFSYIRSVLLRAFYLPLMLGYYTMLVAGMTSGGVEQLIQKQPYMHGDFQGQGLLVVLLAFYAFFSSIDLLFASIGYIFTFKILDAEVRSTEPTLFGWIVCVFCYDPFITLITIPLLFGPCFNNPPWYHWLAGHHVIFTVWGAAGVIAMCCESLATLSFGIRFSNLTYRGLIANGLFRFTKHPQYVSKALRFLFFFMPFLSVSGFAGAVVNCGSFLSLCIVYYLRARTEENHLSVYPEYVEYAKIMNQKSIFRFMNRIFPFLRYDETRAKAGKLF
jgi:hypothetical protein